MKKLVLLIVVGTMAFDSLANVLHVPAGFPTIQQGINSSADGDTVLVSPGTYYENINFSGKNIVVASLYLTTNDTAYISSTIIASPSAYMIDKSVVTFESGETTQCQLCGFTLTGGIGNLRAIGPHPFRYGGGLYCHSASPLISHVKITLNQADCAGGMFFYQSQAVVEHCSLNRNTAYTPITDAPCAGGGVALWNSPLVSFTATEIKANTAIAGAGIYGLTSTASFVNCLLTQNHSYSSGSVAYADSWFHLRLVNSTIYGNVCDTDEGLRVSGTIYCLDSANVRLVNSISYGNQPAAIVCQFNYSKNTVSVSHSDFEGGPDSIFTNNGGSNCTIHWLSGNIDADPQFVYTGADDLHLAWNSPCINAGDTTGIGGIPLTDLDNNNRFNGTIDMGCYEYQGLTGIEPAVTEDHLQVYPNPASEYVQIAGKASGLVLRNATGEMVKQLNMPAGQNVFVLPVSDLSEGIYFLHWYNDQRTGCKKIIVAH